MIYDITQPLYECEVYPGDPKPEKRIISSIKNGDVCNLSYFSMCAHNGTHIDAPYHFINDGNGVDKINPEKFVGPCYVETACGNVTAKAARGMLERAKKAYPGAEKRILIKGKATVTPEAARVFSAAGIDLIGNESQTVGPQETPKAVHLELLSANIVLLEGVRLGGIADGVYFLCAAPLNLTGGDGAPVRAILLDAESAGFSQRS